MFVIYRTAWLAIKRNVYLYLMFAVLLTAAEVFQQWTDSSGGGMLAAWFITVYFLHRLLLLGEGGTGRPATSAVPQAVGRFLLVSLLFLALSFGPALWLLIQVMIAVPEQAEGELFTGVAIVSGMLFLLLYWVLLSLFGTALPAAAVRDRFGLRLTLRRARKTALGTAGGLLAGPALFVTLIFASLIAVAILAELPPDSYAPETGLSLSGLLFNFGLQLLALFNATLSVAVLCRAYRKVAPPEIAALLIPEPGTSKAAPVHSSA